MTEVDRYCVESELGRGAMGTVFRARHAGREVALKVLHAHLMADPTMVARFDREAAIVARLHHKNLVNVLDVGESRGQRYMALELVNGPSLRAILANSLMTPARVIALTKQLLEGLEHAHAAGLVHRDLKPENVIVERDDAGNEVPRIVDFGLAVLSDTRSPRLTDEGTIMGTPAYIAPEQARGGDPDPRTDLFALGVIVYEMLAGKQPFEGTSMEIVLANLSSDPPRIADRAHVTVDPLLEAFARKLMARGLADRFASARDARAVLGLIERDRDAASELLGVPYERPIARTVAKLRARKATEPIAPPKPRPAWPLVLGLFVLALIEVLR
jgi:eukaryotic-like serine/threonine-protein kinase